MHVVKIAWRAPKQAAVIVECKQLTDLITDNEYVVLRDDNFRLSKDKAC